MKFNQPRFLQAMLIVTLVLLTIQYELGMEVNLSPDLPTLAPFGFSLAGLSDALHLAGPLASAHAGLGILLTLLSLVTLVLSLRSGIRSVQVWGSLGFLSMSLAATGGILFTLSGFQEDHYSVAMASNFLLVFIFYFLELYCLKPGRGSANGSEHTHE